MPRIYAVCRGRAAGPGLRTSRGRRGMRAGSAARGGPAHVRGVSLQVLLPFFSPLVPSEPQADLCTCGRTHPGELSTRGWRRRLSASSEPPRLAAPAEQERGSYAEMGHRPTAANSLRPRRAPAASRTSRPLRERRKVRTCAHGSSAQRPAEPGLRGHPLPLWGTSRAGSPRSSGQESRS